MPLTDTTVRNAKPGDKPIKLFDGRGLFLLLNPAGGKWWRFKYTYARKAKLLSLGVYPDVTLKQARNKRDELRRQLADGIDPGAVRKAMKAARVTREANSFEAVAREWSAKRSPTWAPTHAEQVNRRLERDIFPWIGARPIAEINAPELLTVLRRVESRGALEVAHRELRIAGQVFRYAVATGRAERDPSADLRGALPPVQTSHLAAITDPKAVGALLRAIEGYQGSLVTKCALRLAPLLFVRPGELRKAEWSEFDLEAAEWNIPIPRLKIKKREQPHLVPLAVQAVAILRELHPLTGSGRYVFPSVRTTTRPISENTVNAGLRRLGFTGDEICGHGFRAMARTILDEVLNVRPDYIEHQLAHAVRDPNGRAYNRTAFLPARRQMMQQWADYLDGLKAGDGVIPLHAT
jgi:integrase